MGRSIRIAVLGLGLLLGACNAPTLPLPPPTALVSALMADGTVTVSGDALGNAYVSCLNARSNRGVIVQADASGHFELSIEAEIGDSLNIWQHVGTDTGPIVERTVGDPGATDL